MSEYPRGTKIGAPLTNGSAQALFGTHIDYLGVGGFRTVPTNAERDAIPVKDKIEYDGGGSGQRREGMLVYIQDTKKTYQLIITNYANLSDAEKVDRLATNNNWQEVDFGASVTPTGETIVDITYLDNVLTFTTDVTTRTFDLSDLVNESVFINSFYYDTADKHLRLSLNNGIDKTADLKPLFDYVDTSIAAIATSDVTKAYVDAADAALADDINNNTVDISNLNIRINNLPKVDVNKAYVDAADAYINTRIDNLSLNSDVTKAYVDAADTALQNQITNKVDKVAGKGLSTEDYTTTEKTKLAGLFNFDPSNLINKITTVEDTLSNKVDKIDGKGLSDQNFTLAEKQKLTALQNGVAYNDTELRNRIVVTENALPAKVDKVAGKGLSTEDYTTAEKTKLAGLTNADVSKAYVDAANTALQTNINVEKKRIDDLINSYKQLQVRELDEYTVTQDGLQTITLPANTSGVFDLNVLDNSGGCRPIYQKRYYISNTSLVISSDANLKVGDKICGSCYTNLSYTDNSSVRFTYTLPLTLK